MPVFEGKENTQSVDVCALGCEGATLDDTLQKLNADGWNIRQIFQEPPTHYRVFAQRKLPAVPDVQNEEALSLLRANIKLSNLKIVAVLREAGIQRGLEWVRRKKLELLEADGGMMP